MATPAIAPAKTPEEPPVEVEKPIPPPTVIPTKPITTPVPFVPLQINLQPIQNPVVPREKWGAQKSSKPLEMRDGPVSRVVVTYAVTETCETEPQCVRVIRDLQDYYITDKHEADLPFNFMVGGDGNVYEGRGWKAAISHPKFLPVVYDDGKLLSVAFVGDFSHKTFEKPTEHMVQARRALIRYGEENGLLEKNLEILTTILGKI